MTSKNIGLIPKYWVERTDGKVKENAQYFVLDLANDPGAVPAIKAYINWCAANGYDMLAIDLEQLMKDLGKV